MASTVPDHAGIALGTDRQASAVVRFWREACADRCFRQLLLDPHWSLVRREHDSWQETSEGSPALVILLDQFPRNAFRGKADMYAPDALARHFARLAQTAGRSMSG
ncbi:DUF924 family protein [Pseudomonas aeruginosa]|uniref:DUF924 family protein n=1 Tax=Pseudomonas aeruginosa TaxID=287 RepID=UPI00383B65F7